MQVRSILARRAREPAVALARAAITVFRDTTSLQAARQVNRVVRRLGDSMSEFESDLGCLFARQVGKLSDRAMRLFAVECCRRVCQFLTDHWQHGIDVAERFAEGKATRDELVFRLGYLTRDFEDVIESDNGEIYAAKQAVLACLDPSSPFDPTEAASKASKSVGCSHDTEEARREEQAWQVAEFQAYIAGAV